ncbi:MAG: hypothetical protein QHI38_10245 [Armatimonadota bacterium]|nr:hypothetical protein [Armatimonadota bacterium]
MLKKTHLLIAQAIAQDLQLTPDLSETLRNASVWPDLMRDFPHHGNTLKLLKAQSLIRRARWCWIRGYQQQTLEDLGQALHYVQDGCVPPVEGDQNAHHIFEENAHIFLAQHFGYAVANAPCVKGAVDTLKLATSAVPDSDPERSSEVGVKLSFAIARSVCGPVYSAEVNKRIEEIHAEYTEAAKQLDNKEIRRLVSRAANYEASRGLLRLVRKLLLRFALYRYTRARHLASAKRNLTHRYLQVYKSENEWFILPPLNPNIYSVDLISFSSAVRELGIPPWDLANQANSGRVAAHWILGQRWFYRSQLRKVYQTYRI